MSSFYALTIVGLSTLTDAYALPFKTDFKFNYFLRSLP